MSARIRTRVGAVAAAALTAVGTTACGNAWTGVGVGLGTPPTILEVDNHNWHDVKIYVATTGPCARLGTVTSQTRERFAIPTAYVRAEGMRVEVALLGGNQRTVARRVNVQRGDQITLTVENQVALTSYAVYPR